MAQDMTYAKALNEAKQVIIQQQHRIKADAEKIKTQQQTILDQANALSEGERQIQTSAAEVQRLAAELKSTSSRLEETSTSLQQAEAVVNRQGEKITSLQSTVAQLEERSSGQAQRISELTSERDEIQAKLPTSDDIEALNSMTEMLARRPSKSGSAASTAQMRIASDAASEPSQQGEAA